MLRRQSFTVKQIRRENAVRSASQEEHMNPVIRKMREDDFDMLYALLSDPAVMAYLEPPYGEEQTRRFQITLYRRYTAGYDYLY